MLSHETFGFWRTRVMRTDTEVGLASPAATTATIAGNRRAGPTTTASHATSAVACFGGPYGTVPAGLAQHSSPSAAGAATAGVHSLI